MGAPNVQIGAKVKFLEAELFGAFDHRDLGDKKSRDTVLVKQMNAGDQQTGIRVSKIAESIANSIKKITKPKGTGTAPAVATPAIKWPAGVKEIVDSLLVQISEVYLKIVRETGKPTDVEYAIGIGIKLDLDSANGKKLIKTPPFDLIQPEELFLKIWKTDNSDILDEMNIIDFDKLLPDPSK